MPNSVQPVVQAGLSRLNGAAGNGQRPGGDKVIGAKLRPPSVFAWERPQLAERLARAWKMPLTLVVAPAGSGKTTALAQFAAAGDASGHPVAWYWAEESDGDAGTVLRYLDAAVAQACGTSPGGWASVEDAAAALDSWSGPDMALVLDDLHAVEGTPAEAALEKLVAYLPPSVHLIAAARRPPAFNLPRLRVSEQLVEIGPDDLRFRPWEADRLFRDHFGDPMPPDELFELLRRTDGWAAGLRMFRLATQGKSPAERRRTLAVLSSRLQDLRHYVDRNVFDGLDGELRTFLVRTSVLGRMTAAWCDELLDGNGSSRLLEEVERRHRFFAKDGHASSYRCSEVLRSRLEELMAEELGAAEARELHRRAGRILAAGGALPEALRAYCRGEDWDAAEGILTQSGGAAFGGLAHWVDVLPPSVADYDAWRLLAKARRQVAGCYWHAAIDTYSRAEEAFGDRPAAEICRREQAAIASWLDVAAPPGPDWTGRLRHSLSHYSADSPRNTTDPWDALAAGLGAIAAGWFDRGVQLLETVSDTDSISPAVGGAARFASAAVRAALERKGASLVQAAEAIETIAPPWLGQLLLTFASSEPDEASRELYAARRAAQAACNPWAIATLALAEGITLLLDGETRHAAAVLADAGQQFDRVDAGVLGAWAVALEALAVAATDPEIGRTRATAAAQSAETAGCGGALALALRVIVATGAEPLLLNTVRALEADGVIDLSWLVERMVDSAIEPGGIPDETLISTAPVGVSTAVRVRCFSEFSITIEGRPVDFGQVKPRARSLLQLLALHAGQFVHRDQLLAALWPDDGLQSGLRNLQVAMSSLRRLLEPCAARGQSAIIVREGDSYRLTADGASGDISMFEQSAHAGRKASDKGNHAQAAEYLRHALFVYAGDLLPEAGSAEWVLEPRERYRLMAASTAQLLAECRLTLGEVDEAVTASERGLEIDRYRDGLWRTLIASCERAEDHLAAARARRRYEDVLDELEISITPRASRTG